MLDKRTIVMAVDYREEYLVYPDPKVIITEAAGLLLLPAVRESNNTVDIKRHRRWAFWLMVGGKAEVDWTSVRRDWTYPSIDLPFSGYAGLSYQIVLTSSHYYGTKNIWVSPIYLNPV
ncbi:hypothetical protein E8E15_000150 [Penicillium rubens]|nr:hypothetical protein E8E15_000150 [Penicillium rubens]